MESELKNLYSRCVLCPRMCGVDRNKGEPGFCAMTSALVAARASLHLWEEPCISGEEGSGTVFFSGCSLKCIYCQNREIALGRSGKEISEERLSEIFLELQAKGANNINLVTPSHFIPHIVGALRSAKASGLFVPVVYNTSGYERPENIKLLEGLVDVWLPDFKYMSPEIAKEYSSAPDYHEYAKLSLSEEVRQAGKPAFDSRGMMTRGVIVRHLVLPGHTGDSKRIIRYLHETYGDSIYISIMNQYTPLPEMKTHPLLSRKITEDEYREVVDYAVDIGVKNGFIQDDETAEESFIPPFDNSGI